MYISRDLPRYFTTIRQHGLLVEWEISVRVSYPCSKYGCDRVVRLDSHQDDVGVLGCYLIP